MEKEFQEAARAPADKWGIVAGADTGDPQDTVSAPVKQVDTKIDGLSQEEITNFINALKIIKVDKTSDQGRTREDHTKMYVPTLVKTATGATKWASITMALPDSENLLTHTAINAEFHAKLGISIKDTKIKARAANK